MLIVFVDSEVSVTVSVSVVSDVLAEAFMPLQLIVSLSKLLSLYPAPVLILKVPPDISTFCADCTASLDAVRLSVPPLILMIALHPASAFTSSGSERTASPPCASTVMTPELIFIMLSHEIPFFADSALSIIFLMVSVPYSPTLTAFLVTHFILRVPLPQSVRFEFAFAFITPDSAYSAFVPSAPSAVSPYVSALLNSLSDKEFTVPCKALIFTGAVDSFFIVTGDV